MGAATRGTLFREFVSKSSYFDLNISSKRRRSLQRRKSWGLGVAVAAIVTLSSLMNKANAATPVCSVPCDSDWKGATSSTHTSTPTLATDTTTTMTTAYLDPVVSKPTTSSYYIRSRCSNGSWNICLGSTPLSSAYTVSISPAACQQLLYWDTAATQPCTSTKSVADVTPYSITAKVTLSTTTVGSNTCTVSYQNKAIDGTTTITSTFTFSLVIQACNANALTWTTTGFTIAAQTYYVYDAALTITASLATQTNACGYAVTYSLINSAGSTAADSAVFSITTGTPNTINIQTNNYLKAGSYSLKYRAQITNLRTSTAVVLDSAAFTVTITDRCATTSFTTLNPALVTMSTTAFAQTTTTQALNIRDSVSSANGNSDGLTYCGNRVFTIQTAPGSQTFLTITSGSLSSTMTLKSLLATDNTLCSSCTIAIKVCFSNYPTLCTTLHPSFTVTIGACVVTSYTVAAYADVTYNIGSGAATTPYPTYTQSPACGYTASKTVTVNNNAFPGTNLNAGGAAMSTIFTDDTTNKKFGIIDSNLADGTNTYTFVFTSNLPTTPVVSTQCTFKIILTNPCLTTTVQDSGQTITLTGTELLSSTAVTITQFKNSYSVTVANAAFCGGYTYSLTGYTGSYLTLNSATPSIQVTSTLNTDNSNSPYSVGLKGCLTNYPTLCFTKALTVTISDCVITSYVMTTGQTALTSPTPALSYTVGQATALTITLPLFTQAPACGYTETKTCYYGTTTTPCPSWLTATSTTWTVSCSNPTTCPAANYDLSMKTALNNTGPSSVVQTQRITIVDPCTTATITVGTVNAMTTSALKTPAVTQTLSQWSDSASTAAGIANMCGATTLQLAGTFGSWITVSGLNINLLSTAIGDVGTYNNVQIKQCLTNYPTRCGTVTITVTITACSVTSWTPNVLATQTKYILDTSSTSAYTTWTQSPACTYTYTTAVSISGTALPTQGVTATSSTVITYYSITRAQAGTFTINWTPTVSGSCVGVCNPTAQTSSLIWKDACQKTVLDPFTVTSKSTTALATPGVVWTFGPVKDSVAKAQSGLADGVTYCGARTYTLTGNGAWLTKGSGTNDNLLTLLSTSLTDTTGSPFTVTLTTSLPTYSDVLSVSTTFTITIGACVVASVSGTGQIAAQTYIIGATQQTIAFPTYTQSPACGYTPTYTFQRGTNAYATSDPLLSVASGTQFTVGVATDTNLSGTTSIAYQIKLKVAYPSGMTVQDMLGTFTLTVVNPCGTTTWVANSIAAFTVAMLSTKNLDITIKDSASSSYGNMNGITLCGLRTYTWSIAPAVPTTGFIAQITTTDTGDTLKFTPTTAAQQGSYTLSLTACLPTYIASCYSQYVNFEVLPCQVTSSTKIGGNAATVTYIPFTDGTITQTFPTYTQSPACGYTWVYTLEMQDGSAVPSFMTQLTLPDSYSIYTQTLSHAGTYLMRLSMSLAAYPAVFTPYEDNTLTWTVTVTSPCSTTTLNPFPNNFVAMTASQLTYARQAFSHPTDAYSFLKDQVADYNYYTVPTPYTYSPSLVLPVLTGPAKGVAICGARSYTVLTTGNAACPNLLQVYTSYVDFAYIRFYPTMAYPPQTMTCTVQASLASYPTVTVTKTITITITACIVTSLTPLWTRSTSVDIVEYDLFGSAASIPFPTYTQNPACGYTPTYVCTAAINDATMQTYYPFDPVFPYQVEVPFPTTTITSIANINGWVKCDTVGLKVTADINLLGGSIPTDLTTTAVQYNGDYNIGIQATYGTAPTGVVKDYIKQLRVINPCGDPTLLDMDFYGAMPAASKNIITPYSFQPMTTSVKAASQPVLQTWTAFTDAYSAAKGGANGYTLCGARTYSYTATRTGITQAITWLTLLTPVATPNANRIEIDSQSDTDIGVWTIKVTATLKSPNFSNITASTSFQVTIAGCTLTSFTAPTLAAQTFTVYTGPYPPPVAQTFSIPAYTQTPACSYPVQYTPTIEKTLDATDYTMPRTNTRRGQNMPRFTPYYIDGGGVNVWDLGVSRYFIYHSLGTFTVFTDDLMDAGTYTIFVTAEAFDNQGLLAATNTVLSFTFTMVDPCYATQVNIISADPSLNVVSPSPVAITTSVKLGSWVSYSFGTYLDSISYNYGQYADASLADDITWLGTEGQSNAAKYLFPYDKADLNSDAIYCGKRQYFFNGATTANVTPFTWLIFYEATGTLSAKTDLNADIQFSPGHTVSVQACLEFYPTRCSAPVDFIVKINECQITWFGLADPTQPQPNMQQFIFDASDTKPIATYLQVPDCGWIQTYTAFITGITELPPPQTVTAAGQLLRPYSVNDQVSTGSPAWATFDTVALSWTVNSVNFYDAAIFTINQVVTLDSKLSGVLRPLVNRQHAHTFTIEFTDPCWTTSFILQNALGETFYDSGSTTTPFITISVKFGTDSGGPGTVGPGTPDQKSFDFHKDVYSESKPNPKDSSTWVCGPRTYNVPVVQTAGASQFVTVIDSPNTPTTTQPILSFVTSLDTDIAWNPAHKVELTFFLTRYPTVTATEYFYVQVKQCILNTLSLDTGTLGNPANSPYEFTLYRDFVPEVQFAALPTYLQSPLCGYQLSYDLTQIETWDAVNSVYITTPIISTFAYLDAVIPPTKIIFSSTTWTDDQCTYGPTDMNVCDNANSNPYRLMVRAYVHSDLLVNPIGIADEFPVLENTDEKFYIRPIDPCHSTTLVPPDPIPQKSYFLGDVAFKFTVPITPDTISQDTTGTYNLVDFTGYEFCGPRLYQLLDGNGAPANSQYASVPLENTPPTITVFSTNLAHVGLKTLTLRTTLKNYPHISADWNFQVQISNFKIGKTILDQYYQITKSALLVTWDAFTISPPPTGSMPIFYSPPFLIDKNGVPIYPTPTWLTCDSPALRTFKVYTNQFSDAGVYDVAIQGTVTIPGTSQTYQKLQIVKVEISKTAPPQLSTTPPNFTLPLVDQEFNMGEAYTFTLPATYSVGGFAIKVTVKGPQWLNFDSKTLVFTVKQGATKKADAVEHPIQITLQDTTGAKSTYNFKLNCIPPVSVPPPVFKSDAAVAYPIPKITKVTNKGLVTVVWDQQMRIPRNLTQVAINTCDYVNPTTYEIERQPNLDVQILRGNGNEGKNLTFTWNFTSWDTKAMTIQLYFAIPEDVSYGVDPEKIQLIFYGMTQFVSQTGIPVNGGRDVNKNSIPIYKLPPQVALKQVVVVRRNNKAGMTTGQIGPMLGQLGISALLNSVWEMVDTQQIVILLPLFNIVLPSNAAAFFAQLMTIAAFAIIPTDPIFGYMFAAPPAELPQPLSDNFMAVGFATTYITNNMGTLFFSLMYFPIMACVYLIIKPITSKFVMKHRISLGRRIFWSKTFQTFSNEYTIIATCSLIQLANLDWEKNYGTKFCSFLGCFYTAVTFALPFVVSYICWKNYDLIKSGDKEFKQRFGSMWAGFSTEDKGFILYHWYFLMRRFMISALCIYSKKFLFFQVSGLIFNIILATIIQGSTLSLADKRLNTIEYFNEAMIMMVMYCLICFTDFVPDLETRSLMGYVCEFFVIFHIAFNLSFLFGDKIMQLKLRYKRWSTFRQYAKMRAEKNYVLQKQLRHQRFVDRMKKNEEREAEKERKRLQPIEEESKEGSVNSRRSYEYQREDEIQGSNQSQLENSQQDLNYGDHHEITKGIGRQPAEAPEIQIHRLKEFADSSTTANYAHNQKLGLQKPVEFSIDMEKRTHNNLVRNVPRDTIQPDVQSIMNEGDWGDENVQTHAQKLQRRVYETPLSLAEMNPMQLVHNKLARMVQHDTTIIGPTKVKPDVTQGTQLKVLADTSAAHSKLFQRMEPGDASKISGTEAYKASRNTLNKRKLIVTDEDLNQDLQLSEKGQKKQTQTYQDDRPKIKVPMYEAPYKPIKKAKRDELQDLIEEEKLEDEENSRKARMKDQEEVNELIRELSNVSNKAPVKKPPSNADHVLADKHHDTHVRLFGKGVGKSANAQLKQQDNWNAY